MTHLSDIVFTILGALMLLGLLGVAGYRSLKRHEDPPKLVLKWIISVAVLIGLVVMLRGFPVAFWPVVVLIPAVILGILWVPSVGAMVARPLTSIFDGGDEEVVPQPFFSIAEAKRAKGLYKEAAEDVRRQLEKFPTDVTGTLLLGSIIAENLKDLPAARQLVNDWLGRPHVAPPGAAALLNALADWELKVGRDPEAARACLERVVNKYPGTQFSHQAQQRIARMPTLEQFQQAGENLDILLTEGEKDIGLRAGLAGNPPPDPTDNPDALAQTYVEQLRKHPADTETREKLAMLYAEHFQRLDLATDELEQLIALAGESPKHIAGWLNLLATLQIRHGADVPAAEKALRRIMERFPNSAFANQAFERLPSLNLELTATEKTPIKQLGQYEKNIGLKQRKV